MSFQYLTQCIWHEYGCEFILGQGVGKPKALTGCSNPILQLRMDLRPLVCYRTPFGIDPLSNHVVVLGLPKRKVVFQEPPIFIFHDWREDHHQDFKKQHVADRFRHKLQACRPETRTELGQFRHFFLYMCFEIVAPLNFHLQVFEKKRIPQDSLFGNQGSTHATPCPVVPIRRFAVLQ